MHFAIFFNCIPTVYLSIWFTTVNSLGVGIIFYSSLYHKHISQYLANSKNLLNTWMNVLCCGQLVFSGSHSTQETWEKLYFSGTKESFSTLGEPQIACSSKFFHKYGNSKLIHKYDNSKFIKKDGIHKPNHFRLE